MSRHSVTTRRRTLSLAVGLVLAVLPLAPAGADLRATGALTAIGSEVRWSGEFVAGAVGPAAADPATCAVVPACDQVALDVNVPAGSWEGAPGGLMVAIQWPVLDWTYDLDIHLYRAGESSPAAAAKGMLSRYEALWLPNPAPGRYVAVVTAKELLSQPVAPDVLNPIRYEGSARIERGLTVERVETNLGQPFTRRFVAFDKTAPDADPLLPDIVPTKPANFHVETGLGAHMYFYADRGLRHQPSCYPQETTGLNSDEPRPGRGPLRCLRWDQGEYNFGDGPLELHNYPDRGSGKEMWQRVYSADGAVTQRPVGESFFSDVHGHLHYLGFHIVTLHEVGPDGGPGRVVVEAPDKGICLLDIEAQSIRSSRTSPSSYTLPGHCDAATNADPHDPNYPGSSFFAMGLSVGAADIYPWFIADQYIDVTNVPDGRYLIRVEIDAGKQLDEKRRDNNVAVGCVDLQAERATPC
jgi:hypothetical protein